MSDITIRSARPADAEALRRLAELDSRRVPAGELVVAQVGGAIVAAHSPSGTIADPFRGTADAVELLRVSAEAGHRRARTARHRRLSHLRLRVA